MALVRDVRRPRGIAVPAADGSPADFPEWAEQAQNGISRAFSGVRAGGGLRRDPEIPERIEGKVVTLIFVSWNLVSKFLRKIDELGRQPIR